VRGELLAKDLILKQAVASFSRSARDGWFNGVVASSLLPLALGDESQLRMFMLELTAEGKIACVFACADPNMHIKRMPDLRIEKQIELISREPLERFCIYPTSKVMANNARSARWRDRPFSKCLFLAEPQLNFRAFDMAVLERYTSDPRYDVKFFDYMGSMSVEDDPFRDDNFPERDKIGLQTFGLGFDNNRDPFVIVFLRYLAELSPEHQQYWNSFISSNDVRMCRQYYESSIEGNFWENSSVRFAIEEEIRLMNTPPPEGGGFEERLEAG
jgi:hypothetical protein